MGCATRLSSDNSAGSMKPQARIAVPEIDQSISRHLDWGAQSTDAWCFIAAEISSHHFLFNLYLTHGTRQRHEVTRIDEVDQDTPHTRGWLPSIHPTSLRSEERRVGKECRL